MKQIEGKTVMGFILALVVMIVAVAATSGIVFGQETDNPDGLTAKTYNVNYFMEYGRVVGDYETKFSEPVSGKIVYELPLDAKGILLYVDGEEKEVTLVGNRAVIDLEKNKEFRLEYISKIEVSANELVTTVQYPFNAEKTTVRASLPSNARLTEPYRVGSSRSIFPKPKAMGTDGLNIDIRWEFMNKQVDEDVPILIKYMIPSNTWIYALVLVLLLAVLGLGIMVLRFRKKANKRPKIVVKKVVSKDQDENEKSIRGSGYEEHLKEDEQQVVNVLKMKEGSCEQGTLRVVTGFSKAKLSGLLKEMDQRKIIHKEKRGKKNLVFLKKQ